MTDYGHHLEFGTFITPSATDPAGIVALAKLSESLGYDLVTFQDHPYMSDRLEVWTLLSWVAAETDRIRLSANVLNLALRPPATLARAVASLDLLSGGRLELGLGAGAFPAAVAAMGAQVREKGAAVRALSEAIDIIRAMWDTDSRRGVRHDGDEYQIIGAQPGPIPAHDIPIWIGGYKPKMLELIGQKGDGWLPTLKYASLDDLAAGNRAIDVAAEAAGRDPREIRRLLNISGSFQAESNGVLQGPPEQWVSDLLPIVRDHGFGTLILMADDAETMTTFANEVIPALRSALPEARSATVKRSSIRAQRRAGVDYEGIPVGVKAIEPGDIDYPRVKSTYMRGGAPGVVLQPANVEQVIVSLAYARRHPELPMAVRSGGHGVSGRSTNDGGIVIDLGALNAIEVLDEATRRVRIEPGARWMEVAIALGQHGWALSSGDYGGVGVGGLATAGGIGWMARKHGLTIDHLWAVDVVLADGSLVHASGTENPDLFWAVRGAGANFGIVVSFEFEVDEVGEIGFSQLVFDASDLAGLLVRWGEIVENAPRDLSSFIIVSRQRSGEVYAIVLSMIDSNEPETILARLQPMASIAPLVNQSVYLTTYPSVMSNAALDDHSGAGEPLARSGLIEHITPEFATAAERLVQSGASYFFQIRSVGGAVSDVDPDATAYAHRLANFSVVAFGSSPSRLEAIWPDLYEHFDGLYLSFESTRSIERLYDAFPPKTLERLRELKGIYDPENVFRDNFNIAPRAMAR
jgi:alkanesulfonate monooxygenase SsuD/methylene tetrahydromethanopterin reductase-like flavin-dependent oxidoreductase (luciferase family)